MIATRLNKLAINWFTAILAALVLASAISFITPPAANSYTPEQAKTKLEAYSQQSAQQHYLSLAGLYDSLAEYAEYRAEAAAATGYASIDDVLAKPDDFYQQAEQYRQQADNYRDLAYTR